MMKTDLALRKSSSSIVVALLAFSLVSCGNGNGKVKPPPDVKEVLKNAPVPNLPDVKSYQANTVARDKNGNLMPPWREVYSCDDQSKCTTKTINEVTKQEVDEMGMPVKK